MWSACTRWYLPLVLLPLPIAPPYFLVLFLLSTTLHARPCFYCIMLLTAMFMASCYWPPVSLDTPLSRPWSDNITTFGDALLARIPDLPTDMIPAAIPIVDRCWCELTMGFFEPFNTTRWELNSIDKLKGELERKVAARRAEESRLQEKSVALWSNTTAGYSVLANAASGLAAMQRRLGFARSSEPASNASAPSPAISSETPQATGPPLSTWRAYDLLPYGLDMVVDLGWPASP